MNIESLSAVTNTELIKSAPVLETPVLDMQKNAVAAPAFIDYVNELYTDINQNVVNADNKLKEYAVGETSSIHDVLLSIEKAKLSFELGLQVRNRLLEGYQEIMRMQV